MPNVVETSPRPARSRGVTRRRLVLVAIAVLLVVAIGAGAFRRDIDGPQAALVADRLAIEYRRGSGESRGNFAPREVRQWADGWEFRWRYRPCADFASLRIWISRDGRRATFAELPDCNPERGFGLAPLKV